MKNLIKSKKLAVQTSVHNRQKQQSLTFLNFRSILRTWNQTDPQVFSSKLKKRLNLGVSQITWKFSSQNAITSIYKFKSLLYVKWLYNCVNTFFVTSKNFIVGLNKVLYCLRTARLQQRLERDHGQNLKLSYALILKFFKGGMLCFYNGMRGFLSLKRYLLFLYWMLPFIFSQHDLSIFCAFQRFLQRRLMFFKVPCLNMILNVKSKKRRKCFVKKSFRRRKFFKRRRNRKRKWNIFFVTPLVETYSDSLYLLLFIKKISRKNEEIKRVLSSFWNFYRNLVRIRYKSRKNFIIFKKYIKLLKLFLTIKENYQENEKFTDNFWSFYKNKEKYLSKVRYKPS